MEAISEAPQHRFYLLTKQPQELVKWSPFPPNCYVGVSITKREELDGALLYLGRVEASVKFISFEPLLESMEDRSCRNLSDKLRDAGIDWAIIGAQTRPSRPPKWEWVREIIEAADKAGVAVFLKDSLGLSRMTWEGSPPYYRREIGTWVLRQEMPSVSKDSSENPKGGRR